MIGMFKKKPILKYESELDEYMNIITPTKNHVPEWYKKIPKFKDSEMFTAKNEIHPTVKHCMPFLDSLTTGYVITLPYDLYVKNNNGVPFLTWPPGIKNPPKWRDQPADLNIVPVGHFPVEYTWSSCVAYSIPKGYSALFIHPLNRYDLPFTTLSGIIDGGFVVSAHGNAPFYIKQDFEGIIKQGTPIAQIIPFRQEKWLSKMVKGLVKIGNIDQNKANSVFWGWYKKTIWSKKHYN